MGVSEFAKNCRWDVYGRALNAIGIRFHSLKKLTVETAYVLSVWIHLYG
jgi:hypothetical protein